MWKPLLTPSLSYVRGPLVSTLLVVVASVFTESSANADGTKPATPVLATTVATNNVL